ncbi:hypothetical protein DL770_008007 [Monosporascus sp. CRB-9-2]|nr:hypothetical protein DL770_008007 [Monosporascus sp. CRB-9-2]
MKLHTHQNGQYGLQQMWCHFQTHEHIEMAPRVFNSLGYQTDILGKVHVGHRGGRRNGRLPHLTVGLRDPHRDETREGFGNDEDDVRDISAPDYRTADVEIPPFISDAPQLRTEFVEYYKSIGRMDLGVGLILGELAKRDLDRNTLVIFVSDNGSPFLNSKTALYDTGARLPLLLRQPGGKPGVVNPSMVSLIDILPRCIEWARAQDSDIKTSNRGKSPPQKGTSLLRALGDSDVLPSETWTQHVFGSHTFHEIQNYWPTRFMRNHRAFGMPARQTNPTPREVMSGRRRLQNHVYRRPEELFDLEDDPEEVGNLAGRPEFEALLRETQAELEVWQYETDGPWLSRDGVSGMTTHAAQKLGVRLPARFDFEPKNPGSAAGPHWAPPFG